MRGPRHDVRQLAQLSTLSEDDLRTGFRAALADLARAASELSTPLEGLDPKALLASIRRAESAGLLEDFQWLSPPAAASALYHIASALPPSPQRTMLEARVDRRLTRADAATFVTLATALAQSARRRLESPRLRAHVSLCLSLPVGTHTRSESLALALISRPDLAHTWLEEPSQGALPGRRLAARILEQAARAAARKHGRGDTSGLYALESPLVRGAFKRLLEDRESLVWKHAAAARGLLSGVSMPLADEIEMSLDPVLTPTEWRRGAASLAARIAVEPEEATAACRALLEGPLAKRDPGVAAAMLLGLPRAAEAEPHAVEPLLVPLLRTGGVYATEAFVDLLDEGLSQGFGEEARRLAQRGLEAQLNKSGGDEGQRTLMEALLERLLAEPATQGGELRAALYQLASQGIDAATPRAIAALQDVETTAERIAAADLDQPEGRRAALRGLIDLEGSALQSSALSALLMLTPEADALLARLDGAHDRLGHWLGELSIATDARGEVRHPTLQMRAIRALLHLVDHAGDTARHEAHCTRRLRLVRGLLRQVATKQPTVLRRALIASTARGCEALVRDETFELSDVMIGAMTHLPDTQEIQVLGEASMQKDMETCLFAIAELSRRATNAPDNPSGRRDAAQALRAFVHALPAGHSPRTTALRETVLRIQRSLEQLLDAEALVQLAIDDGTTLADDLVHSLQVLAQLVVGARRRIDPDAEIAVPALGDAMQTLADAIERAVQQRDPSLLRDPLAALSASSERELPAPLHTTIRRVLGTLPTLPLTPRRRGASMGRVPRVTLSTEVDAPVDLPDWLPPSRVLGSFYVLHSIGEGGGGSVFVAKRRDERNNPAAELVALKVPEYNGDAARALSEQDFLQMFREEAGALLAMPQDNPHLARFVTFDAGVRPKPILVMEYVEGPSLERLLARRHLDTRGAFDALIGIARGLSTMHTLGVAHLDVKPSNVILRGFWSGTGLEPVLVDFGMSGRRLRPGCCTAGYGAPEIWNEAEDADPRPADIYALGCLAFEVLTGRALFQAPSDVAMISAHMMHDGTPPGIDALHDQQSLRPLAEWLTSCLRRDPSTRIEIGRALEQLSRLQDELADERWPLQKSAPRKQVQPA